MSPQSILIGQIFIVFTTIILTTWYATQWVAFQFDYDAYLGTGLFSVGPHTVYTPWSLFPWWYQFDAYAPQVFNKGGQIAAGGGFVGTLFAVIGSVWRGRAAKALNTFGSSRWASHKLSTDIEISGSADLKFSGWEQDIYIIFANLIDNSLYWIEEKKSKRPKITIKISSEGGKLKYIDYRDTGPGIDPQLIKSNVIFDPEFSTKPDGTGLGLAIAGEAATRNGFELQALESELGVYFRLQYSNDEDENDI